MLHRSLGISSSRMILLSLTCLCVVRNQFFSRFDHMCALMFTFAILGITVLLIIAFALFDCVSSPGRVSSLGWAGRGRGRGRRRGHGRGKGEDDEQSKQEVFGKITSQLRPQCLALEQVVRACVTKQQPTAQEAVQEAAVSKIMRQHAVDFMKEASQVSSKHLT